MSNFTFLEKNQVFHELEIFKKYDKRCAITDFSILLGGAPSLKSYTSEGKDKTNLYKFQKYTKVR